MFKKFKIEKKLEKSKAMKEARTYDHDKEGRSIIEVGLKDSDDFFSPYSYHSYELMNPEVCDYIDMCASGIGKDDELSIDIYTEEATSNEKKKIIRQTVKRHNAEQVVAIDKQLKHNFFAGGLCCLLGFLILFIEAFTYSIVSSMYLDTILAVIGWMFLWDGLELVFYERGELRQKKVRSLKLMNAKVHIRQYSKTMQRQYKIGEFEEDEDDDE